MLDSKNLNRIVRDGIVAIKILFSSVQISLKLYIVYIVSRYRRAFLF